MSKGKVFLKKPLSFKKKCMIYPPSVNDILDNDASFLYIKLLTTSQEDLEDELTEKKKDPSDAPTPMEHLLAAAYYDKEFEQMLKDAFYFFLKQEVSFIYDLKKILLGNLEEELEKVSSLDELNFIEEEEFFDFQNLIRVSLGNKIIEKPDPNEDPRIKRMKAKARYRDKIKAKKNGGLTFDSSLVAICCMGIGITPLNIGDISYAAVGMLVSSYQGKETYEIDISAIIGGADSKKIKPEYWIKNLE